MATEGKPIIFVTPISENLRKLKETINSDEAYSIYEVETAADYAQMAPAIGASLTISSDIKKLAKILNDNKKVIKKFNSKVLLLHDQKLPTAVTQKLEKLGLNEVLYEPIVPKTLLYKVSLLCKSLKNPVVKDTSDVVLKSKVEEKKESDTKVDKDQMLTQAAEKKITTENLTKTADQSIDTEALTQKADNKISLSKNLSVKNDTTSIDNNLDMKLSKDEENLPETDSRAKASRNAEEIPEVYDETPSLGLMEDVADAPKNKKTTIDDIPEPTIKKHLNLAKSEEDIKPTEKNIPDAKAEARKRLREKINNLPPAEKEKAEKTLAQLEMMKQKQREALAPIVKEEKDRSKKPTDLGDLPALEAEKTPQQKLEEKREKLKKLKQMAQEMKEENLPAEDKIPENLSFDENPNLAALEEENAEKAAKALREKKIRELKELSRKANAPLDEVTEANQEFASDNVEDLPLEESISTEENLEDDTPAAKRKRGELNELKDPREIDKDYDLQLMDDEKAKKEEKSRKEKEEHDRQKDYDLELADDDPKEEEEKSIEEAEARKRDKDYDLQLESDENKKKKRHEEEEITAEGFKVKKTELDNNWDYDNQGLEETKEEVVGEAEALNYAEFKEYQESSAYNTSGMKKKLKSSSSNQEGFEEISDQQADSTEEATGSFEEAKTAIAKNDSPAEENFDPFDMNEEVIKKKAKNLQDIEAGIAEEISLKKNMKAEELQREIEVRLEEMIAQKVMELADEVPEEVKKALKMQAIEEVMAKKRKEFTPEKLESLKKRMEEIISTDIYKKEYKESTIEKSENLKKKGKEAKIDLTEKEKTKTMSFDEMKEAIAKMPTVDRPLTEEEKPKTKSYYAPDEEKTKTKSFYKEDDPENVIRYGKRGVLNFVKEQPVAIVTDEEIILEKPYVPYDTKGIEYIAGVRTLHYLEIFNELRVLEFVGNKIMISKNALTTFYFRDPKTNSFELVYSGHKDCLESHLYTGAPWEQFENQNRMQWERTALPTWHDPHFKGDNNFFIFPFYEQEAQLGYAVISFIGQVKSESEGKIVENILSASRCYFLLRYHQALGIEIVDKVVEEMIDDNIETINVFAKVKSMVKSVWGFFKKVAA